MKRADTRFQQLLSLLGKERACLRTADFEALSELASTKEQLFLLAPKDTALSGPELSILRRESERNQKLYTAMLSGLRDVSERLAAIRQNQSGFSTYGRDGDRQRMAIATQKQGPKL